MNDEELRRLRMCVANINDKMQSITLESILDTPYKPYILEKAEPILNDIQVIINICKGGE